MDPDARCRHISVFDAKTISDIKEQQLASAKYILFDILLVTTQQTRNIDPMLFKCWPTLFDVGPTLKQHWLNVLCLLGKLRVVIYPTYQLVVPHYADIFSMI